MEGVTPLIAALADVAAVVLFSAVGRRSHYEPVSLSGTLEVAAPFLLALGLGWLVLRAWRRPTSLLTGLGVWAVTVPVGMLLRRTVFDRGTAGSFIMVAATALAVAIIGWRAALAILTHLRARTKVTPTGA